MKARLKRSAYADAADLQNFFASLPKPIHGELICEIAHHLKQQTTADVPADVETFSSFIDEQQSRDPRIGERIRSIAECVLREQITRQFGILRHCAQAYALNSTDELEAVRGCTEDRLRQFTSAYAALRAVGR